MNQSSVKVSIARLLSSNPIQSSYANQQPSAKLPYPRETHARNNYHRPLLEARSWWRKSTATNRQLVCLGWFRAISGQRVTEETFPRKPRAATRLYRYRGPPVHVNEPPVCRHGIVRLILWNRHVISWPGRLPAGRRVAHANVPLMSSVLRPALPLYGSLLDRPHAFRAPMQHAPSLHVRTYAPFPCFTALYRLICQLVLRASFCQFFQNVTESCTQSFDVVLEFFWKNRRIVR